MPEMNEDEDSFITSDIKPGHVAVEKGTTASYPNTLFDFFFKTPFHIEVSPGERLLIVSRKGQGRSSFINMITGFMKRVDGGVRINGEKAFLS